MAADYVTTRRRRGAQEGAFRRRDPGGLSSLLRGAAAGFSEGMSLQDQMLAREWQRLQIEQEETAEKVRRAAKHRLSLEDSENLFSDGRSSFPGMGRFGPQ
jgi:hypothetical protein